MTAGVSVVCDFLIQHEELKSTGSGTCYNLSVGTISNELASPN
jgi:hypothetical protein